MDELEKGLEVALRGAAAEDAAAEVRRQVETWGLALPDVAPLVLDFGLGDFHSVGEVEFWIANEGAAGYCGKFLFVWEGQTCPKHFHREKLETFFIVRGRIRMEYDGRESTMKTGDVLRVETGKAHRFTGMEPTLILEVSRPSIISDNYFEDTRIPIGGNTAAGNRAAGRPRGGKS
jgi:mannose-6-phosphate isomerase-like protein (cupin superfamily)